LVESAVPRSGMYMSWFWRGDDRIHFETDSGGMFRPAIQTTRKLLFASICSVDRKATGIWKYNLRA